MRMCNNMMNFDFNFVSFNFSSDFADLLVHITGADLDYYNGGVVAVMRAKRARKNLGHAHLIKTTPIFN